MEELFECKGKNAWPELVGKNGDYAKKVVEKENPRVNAIILLEGTPTTKDFRCDRVWIFVDKKNIVVRVPIIT
ncbi:hypothetical protein NMG60_11025487 [Bertholletia excelsa]